jgi:hypothetical protein
LGFELHWYIFICKGHKMKNYRFLGDEAEVLGNRLDHARKSVAGAKTAWAKNYWTQVVERLLFQWQQLPILHDGDAQMTLIPRWTVNYNFYELAEFTGQGITDRAYNKIFRESVDLDTSWHNHREARLAKAQY